MSPFKTPEQQAAKLQSRLGDGPVPATFVLTLRGTVIGSVSLTTYDDIGGLRPDVSPWLSSLLVIPVQRGQGFGQVLVEHCVAEARRLGFPALHLWTDTHERFYERLRWETIEGGNACGSSVAVMRRRLRSS